MSLSYLCSFRLCYFHLCYCYLSCVLPGLTWYVSVNCLTCHLLPPTCISLKLHSLERRRVRGDLFQVFKWVKGFNKGDVGKVLRISSQDRIRNNGFKLEKRRFRKEIGLDWFTNRVVDDWNRLSQQVVHRR